MKLGAAVLTRPHPELLALRLRIAYRPGMDQPAPAPSASRLAEYARAHPGAAICLVEGTWHAWLPDGCGGDEFHGRDEDELLAKLG